jgi:hypothetical protein
MVTGEYRGLLGHLRLRLRRLVVGVLRIALTWIRSPAEMSTSDPAWLNEPRVPPKCSATIASAMSPTGLLLVRMTSRSRSTRMIAAQSPSSSGVDLLGGS